MVSVRKKGKKVTLIATSRGFPAELGKHPSNGRVNFDMVVGLSSGGSFDEINGHFYLTVSYEQS